MYLYNRKETTKRYNYEKGNQQIGINEKSLGVFPL